jgi:hypothetical protein
MKLSTSVTSDVTGTDGKGRGDVTSTSKSDAGEVDPTSVNTCWGAKNE